MPIVKFCCCGCSLQQGTTGSAIYALIDGLLLVLGGIFLYATTNVVDDDVWKEHNVDRTPFIVMAVILGKVGFILVILSSILLCSLRYNGTPPAIARQVKYTSGWIIGIAIRICLDISVAIVIFVGYDVLLVGKPFSTAIGLVINAVLYLYLIIVVYSYRQTLLESPPPMAPVYQYQVAATSAPTYHVPSADPGSTPQMYYAPAPAPGFAPPVYYAPAYAPVPAPLNV